MCTHFYYVQRESPDDFAIGLILLSSKDISAYMRWGKEKSICHKPWCTCMYLQGIQPRWNWAVVWHFLSLPCLAYWAGLAIF